MVHIIAVKGGYVIARVGKRWGFVFLAGGFVGLTFLSLLFYLIGYDTLTFLPMYFRLVKMTLYIYSCLRTLSNQQLTIKEVGGH